MIFQIDIDYGKGLTKLMDFDTTNPMEELDMPAGELLAKLLSLCPSGIRLEINSKERGH